MSKLKAAITAVEGYVPDYILTNDELSQMVDTSDEWIMTRIGIKERLIWRKLLWKEYWRKRIYLLMK